MMPPLVVLHSAHARQGEANPFVAQTIGCASSVVDAREFSWPRALFGRYDIFHLHWPEHLMRSEQRFIAAAKKLLSAFLLTRLVLRRTPVVWTVHNTSPHQRDSRLNDVMRSRFERRARCRIVMSRHDLNLGADTRLVRHGHYREWFSSYSPAAPRTGRLVYFGLLKEYKGVPELIAAFGGIGDADLALHVMGRAAAPQIERAVRSLAAADGRVTLTLRYVSDAELSESITSAEAVVLPYVEMGNSGAALLALSLDRPIIVPRAPSNAELGAEVGPGWVVEYEPPLSSAKLARALAVVRTTARADRPQLDARSWTDIGARLLECYRDALRSPG